MLGVAEAYKERRDAVGEQADQVIANLNQLSAMEGHGHQLTTDMLDRAYQDYLSRFDHHDGGFGDAPKFPPSMGLSLLLRYWHRTGNANALNMVEVTLEKMARGGMYDQLGGGFHRYSVDERWLVPHFEKMLYDNALLSVTYLEAYQATGKTFYRQIATETLDYVLSEMYDTEKGGFYSTQDADSEGVEGKFFVWEPDEVERLLGEENAKIFCEYYDITEIGNFEHKNILHVQTPPELVARKLGMDLEVLENILAEGKQKLFEVREERIKPGLDDKILTSWNGLMIRSMAMGYQILGDERYREAAEKSARFVLSELSQDNGLLLRTHRAGKSHLNAYLEDYSYFVASLINLYEATFAVEWLREAERLNQIMIDQFWDHANGSFFFTSKSHETLIVRSKPGYDGATPSGVSMAIHSLLRLDTLLNRPDFREKVETTLDVYYHQIEHSPSGSAQMLCELDFLLSTPKQIAIAGQWEREDTQAALKAIHNHFLPSKVLALASDGEDVSDFVPLLESKTQMDGKATIYVCENYTCQAPTTDVEIWAELLQ